MISYEVKYSLPTVREDYPQEALRKVGAYMVRSVQKNFERAGRPAWEPTRSGETPLVTSGKLYRSVRWRLEGNTVIISAGEGLGIYPSVQQYGAFVPITERAKSFFWAMFYQTGEERWKWMALQKVGSRMRIPARPYMMFQDEDIDKIIEIMGQDVFIQGPAESIG